MHLLDTAGNHIRGLGGPNLFPWDSVSAYRFPVRGADGSVWVGEDRNYRLEQVDTLNHLQRVIGIRLQGQPTIMEPLVIGKNVRIIKGPGPPANPRPERLHREPERQIDRAYVDSTGIMWVVVRVADPGWRDIVLTYDDTWPDEHFMRDEPKLQMYRTLIDAIDTTSGEVLARTIVAGYGGLTTDGRVVRASMTSEGYVAVEVSQPVLHREQVRP